ncbi:scavenger receptor cysteine-rich type 1 protein M130-like isoform X2 [Betta splendens]|uniref:Scavenger receptor cysteine-rich type 1 protein M130-like isoform X2 n=1 Tax=Betta splendens TaxID=158456 RepID=A0A9W2Y5U0_BETSP|nr:scavenger receptor cysteine-rich type 1 protein M130-like isoform X2 [Betta splendens]
MDHLLLLLLWSSGTQAEENHMSTEPDELRLVGGDSRCAGILELKHEDWRPVAGRDWTLRDAAVVCKELDCGSVVSIRHKEESLARLQWWIRKDCVRSGSALRECVVSSYTDFTLNLTCSDSVRLLDGTSLCSGRLEVRSNQSNQGWSSVCEADFDQQDAEVVCRELGCGAPSALQGALYGEVEAPVGSKEFQCGGHESALLDCRSSDSARTTCSPGKAVGLTCSEPDELRLVGGDSRCAGILELKHEGDWRPVTGYVWTLKEAAVFCRELDCGSAVSISWREESSDTPMWQLIPECVQSGTVLGECVSVFTYSSSSQGFTCTNSVRLLDGTSLCSGRLEVRSNQSNQGWSSVCEADFDQQDAEVVCRELGCGAPSALQGALYGEVEAPVWSKEFQCGGHESALLDCRSSDSATTTCSPGKAVGLTCSESDEIRLVEGGSRCAGRLEMKLGDWRPVSGTDWNMPDAAVVCRELDCGSAVSVELRQESSDRPVWRISSDCLQSESVLKACLTPSTSTFIQNLICSDLLLQPIISVSSMNGVSQVHQQGSQVFRGFSFTITCSIQPQYPGGSFHLTFTSSSSNAEHNYTQPPFNHSAHFLFPVAQPAHQGNYTCVYQVYVFSHNFSSESHRLSVSVSDPPEFPVKVVFLPLTLLLLSATLYFYCHQGADVQQTGGH